MFNLLLSRLQKPIELSEGAALDWVREHPHPEILAAEIRKLSGWEWIYPRNLDLLRKDYELKRVSDWVLLLESATDRYYLVSDATGLAQAEDLREATPGTCKIAILLPEHWHALNHELSEQVEHPIESRVVRETWLGNGDVGEALETLLIACELQGATDLHLNPYGNRVVARYRKGGALIEHSRYSMEEGSALCRALRQRAGMPIGVIREPMDGTLRCGSQELRLSATQCLSGESLVLRWPGKKLHALHPRELGINSHLLETIHNYAAARKSGWVVVSGSIGAGKTTTLYTILRHLGPGKRIVTLEDPVESPEPGWTQVDLSRVEPARRKESLRAVLRQSPDWLMLGELRDRDGAELARSAIATGHMVWTTLHLVSPDMLNARLESLDISRRELQPYSLLHIHQNWKKEDSGINRHVEFQVSVVESQGNFI